MERWTASLKHGLRGKMKDLLAPPRPPLGQRLEGQCGPVHQVRWRPLPSRVRAVRTRNDAPFAACGRHPCKPFGCCWPWRRRLANHPDIAALARMRGRLWLAGPQPAREGNGTFASASLDEHGTEASSDICLRIVSSASDRAHRADQSGSGGSERADRIGWIGSGGSERRIGSGGSERADRSGRIGWGGS